MRCETHCPAPDGPAVGPLLMVAGLFLMALAVVSWLVANWVLVAAAMAVLGMLATGAAWMMACVGRWSARRTVVTWPACVECGQGPEAHRVAGRERVCLKPAAVPVPVREELVRAPYQLPAPPLAIEAPRYALTASQAPAHQAAVRTQAVAAGSRRASMVNRSDLG